MNFGDAMNGTIELIGALFAWRNLLQLMRDKEVKGVYWPGTAFWSAWGLWNLYFYPSLGQWFSFTGGCVLVVGNLAWIALALTMPKRSVFIALHSEPTPETDAERTVGTLSWTKKTMHKLGHTCILTQTTYDGRVAPPCEACVLEREARVERTQNQTSACGCDIYGVHHCPIHGGAAP